MSGRDKWLSSSEFTRQGFVEAGGAYLKQDANLRPVWATELVQGQLGWYSKVMSQKNKSMCGKCRGARDSVMHAC